MLWRKEDPVLNERGLVVTGGMWEPQRKWWDSTAFVRALVTGYGGGKTMIGAKRSIALALHNATNRKYGEICPHLIVSPSYKMAKRTVIPTLKALLSGKARLLPGFKWFENKSDHEFKVIYKGREGIIWIGSGDDPDSLKGPNIGSALIDEPFIQDIDVFYQVLARIRNPLARQLELGLTGTPEELNWGYDLCEGEMQEDVDVETIHASTRANKALSSDYADRLESGFDKLAVKAYVDGQFILLTKGRVYYAFSDDNIIDLPDPRGELLVGMDFNVNPMAATVFWQEPNHLHCMDEIELPNADTEYMCVYLKEHYLDDEGNCRIQTVYPDATGHNRSTKSPGGKSDFYYIEQSGFTIDAPPSNPAIRDRENAVNGGFKSKSGEIKITVSPKCKKLISYFKKYTHEKKHKQKEMSHLIDSFGYPIHRLMPIERPSFKIVRYQGA